MATTARHAWQRSEIGRHYPPKVARTTHGPHMTDSEEETVMLPFRDKVGMGWHVVIRYHKGHERRIEGFSTEKEALEWIIANSKQVDK
jgi:hypothetical protein